MKLEKVLLGQSGRLGNVSGKDGGEIYGLNLARACEERYGFLEAPRKLSDFDLTNGITFLHGYFEGRFVIDRFQVFKNGFLAEAKIDTDDCDAFVNDVIQWVQREGALQFIEQPGAPKIYLSHIEVRSNITFANRLSDVSALGLEIASIMRSHGYQAPDWRLSGLAFGNGTPGDAASFKLEAREGPQPQPDLFFATARMRTKEHLYVLEKLETLFA
jgi:hypothetical protein